MIELLKILIGAWLLLTFIEYFGAIGAASLVAYALYRASEVK